MPRRTFRQASSLARKTTELSVAAPQVIAHRLVRMALAGPVPGPRERKEVFGMIAEKQLAFAQSWLAMLIEVARVNQRFALLALRPAAWPRTLGSAVDGTGDRQAQQAAIAVASKGLAPIRRKAVSNAKRLARTRLR